VTPRISLLGISIGRVYQFGSLTFLAFFNVFIQVAKDNAECMGKLVQKKFKLSAVSG
jgi:hypothetical protein